MNDHGRHETSSSASATTAIVVVLAILAMAGLVVLGGAAWLFLSFRDVRIHEEMARARAMRAEMEAARARIAIRNEVDSRSAAAAQENGSPDEIPRVASGEITVEVDADGSVRLDGEPTSPQEALGYLTEIRRRDNRVEVRILADRNGQFAPVADLIEACNRHGVSYRVEVAAPAAAGDFRSSAAN